MCYYSQKIEQCMAHSKCSIMISKYYILEYNLAADRLMG